MNKKFWIEGYGSFILAIGIALTIRWALVEAYVIPSGSMLPSLLVNDHIFVNKFVYGLRVPFTGRWIKKAKSPQRGEVIVFRYPENEKIFYIKRVIGVPGDTVLYKSGQLYVNNQAVKKKLLKNKDSNIHWLSDKDFMDIDIKLEDHYHWEEELGAYSYSVLQHKKPRYQETFGPYTVPPDNYFVMGDNRDNSKDSRRWTKTHFVRRDQLIGRAMFVWLSCEKMLPVVSILCNPINIRWKRFFHSIH